MPYVAAYALKRHYGGPEEGGWWWTSGELVHVEEVESGADGFRRRDVLRESTYKDTANLHSVNYPGYGAFSLRVVDDYPVKRFPDEIPYYS